MRFELLVEHVFHIKGRGHIATGIYHGEGGKIGDSLRIEGTYFEIRIKGFELIRFVQQEGVRRIGILVDLQGLEPTFLEGKKLVRT